MSVISNSNSDSRQADPPQTGVNNGQQVQRVQTNDNRNQTRSRFNRNRNGNGGFSNNRNNRHFGNKSNFFKGETAALNGNVFQMQSESKDPTQFKRTVEALERFCDKIYDVDMRTLFGVNPAVPVVERPVQPDDATADALDKDAYREEVKQYVKDKKSLAKSLRALYSVIWGQCSLNVITKLSSLPHIDDWKNQGHCHELLKAIQQILMDYEHKKCIYVTLLRQIQFLYSYKQRDNQSLHKYFEVFQIMTENIERYGGSFGNHPAYVKESLEKAGLSLDDPNLTSEVLAEHEKKAQQKFLGISFLLGGRNDMYEDLVVDLENDYLKGNDYFPSSVNDAYQLMANFSKRKGLGAQQQPGRRNNGIGFMQATATSFLQKSDGLNLVPGVDGITHKGVQCWNCKATGHYSNKCPKKDRVNLLQTAPAEQTSNLANQSHDNNPDVDDESIGFGFLQVSFSQLKHDWPEDGKSINQDWVLLDSQSNCDIFRNKRLLTNIRKADGPGLLLRTNGGTLETNMVGDVQGYGKVWYDPTSLANILSLANVRKRFRITMATGPEDPKPKIIVHKSNGDTMIFYEHSMGLFVHDPTNSEVVSNVNLGKVLDYSFYTTLVSNLEKQFTKQDVLKAKSAQTLYKRLGRPSIQKFYDILRKNFLQGCSVTVSDAERCFYIYGVDPATVKGKAVRTTPLQHKPRNTLPVPDYVRTFHSSITLNVDLMFVHGTPFLTTISENLLFRTIEEIGSRGYRHILPALQKVINLYDARELHIEHIKADPEFECVRDSVLPCILHLCTKSEHVPAIERSIRTIKEHARTLIHGLPYEYYPPILLRYLLYFVVRILNSFPAHNGVSDTISPLTLLTGLPAASTTEFKVEFGSYVQVHDHPNISNTTLSRSTGALALCPANHHGGWYFLSLSTGDRLLRYSWTECQLTNDVVARVHSIATSKHTGTQDLLNDFDVDVSGAMSNDEHPPNNDHVEREGEENRSDEEMESRSANNAQVHNEAQVHDEVEANVEIQANMQIDNEAQQVITDDEASDSNSVGISEPTSTDKDMETLFDIDINQEETSESKNIQEEESEAVREDNDVSKQGNEPDDEAASEAATTNESDAKINQPMKTRLRSMKEDLEKEIKRYNLRSKVKKARDDVFNKKHYNYLMFNGKSRSQQRYVQRMKEREYRSMFKHEISKNKREMKYNKEKMHRGLTGLCLTQMSAHKGIKVYGERAIKAMAKEYSQLDELGVFKGRMANTLSWEERRTALQVIDLIKEKRCGKIKGRTVVDGRGQRDDYDKFETSSKALTLEAFISTLAIDAFEGRDIAIADVAGAFLKADQPDFVLIKLKGPAVKALLQANEKKYLEYVVIEKGVSVMYLELLKAMYGTLTAPILWYKLFAATLLELGFSINEYDACVANKLVRGHQLTVCWYVDDLKVSHIDPEVVTNMIRTIEEKFGCMTVKRGNQQTYLGMEFEIVNKQVQICMQPYLQECIDAFGESLTSNATTPANKNLMEIDDISCNLDGKRREIFHHVVQKLLHISKRGRLDLQVAVGFLCTRVKEPNVSDWNKLRRTLQYIRGTIGMKRILSMGNMELMNIYIDASHGIHWNRRGQTGGCISMGKGLLHARSTKQGINTKSSTETEFVGNSEYLPYAIWLLRFLEEQGYSMKRKLLHQDNESAIKLLKNGVVSATKRSRHVDIRYFWTTDWIKDMEMEVVYCPTERMLADFFTKPLQGKLFRIMRDVVQGLRPYSALNDDEEQLKRKLEFDRTNIVEEGKQNVMNESTYRQERVGNLESERTKKVKFDDGVDKRNKKSCLMKNITYADVLRKDMSQINYGTHSRV